MESASPQYWPLALPRPSSGWQSPRRLTPVQHIAGIGPRKCVHLWAATPGQDLRESCELCTRCQKYAVCDLGVIQDLTSRTLFLEKAVECGLHLPLAPSKPSTTTTKKKLTSELSNSEARIRVKFGAVCTRRPQNTRTSNQTHKNGKTKTSWSSPPNSAERNFAGSKFRAAEL